MVEKYNGVMLSKEVVFSVLGSLQAVVGKQEVAWSNWCNIILCEIPKSVSLIAPTKQDQKHMDQDKLGNLKC